MFNESRFRDGENFDQNDLTFMKRAMDLARQAEGEGEVPVGAVVVVAGQIIGEGWNRPIAACDPTAHAEIEALREAARKKANYRLSEATIYCTLEPCPMCAGAIVAARLRRLVFAARDLRFGAVRSKFTLADSPLLNHQVVVDEGLLALEAGELLGKFFRKARQKNSGGAE